MRVEHRTMQRDPSYDRVITTPLSIVADLLDAGEPVLSIDAASRVVGAVVMGSPEIVSKHLLIKHENIADAFERIEAIMKDLRMRMYEKPVPKLVVLESTEGKVNRHIANQRPVGMAIYGIAVGKLHEQALASGAHVARITGNEWTLTKKIDGKVVPKEPRQPGGMCRRSLLAQTFPWYATHAQKDRGGDIADAIEMCRYFYDRVAMDRAVAVAS